MTATGPLPPERAAGSTRRGAIRRVLAGLPWLGGLTLAAGPPPVLARGKGRTVRLYRANGRYAGRVEPNGRFYDAAGRYAGRVEGQRVYDARGRYLGRFEESGSFRDSDDEPEEAPPVHLQAQPRDDRRTRVEPPPVNRPRKDVIRIVPDNGTH